MKKSDLLRAITVGSTSFSVPVVSEVHLRGFMDAYREEFHEDLPIKEAEAMLSQLVQLYLLIMRPPP